MTTILYKWRIWCDDESAYVFRWLEAGDGEPTTCPNNSSHTISSGLNRIVEIRNPDEVVIKQELVATGGHYQWVSKAFDAIANSTTTHSFSYPLDVNVIQATFIAAQENVGDVWTWALNPNTTIGSLTSNASIGDTVLNVSSTVTENAKVGYNITLTDGTNTNDLGQVVSIDSVNGTITTENATTNAFDFTTPTFVQVTVYFCKDMEFGHPWILEYGSAKITSTFLPANTNIVITYTNNHPTQDKRIVVYIEVMY